jgi:hypothetical protein
VSERYRLGAPLLKAKKNRRTFQMSNLDKQVPVLNKSWQPINGMTVQKALSMMAADLATAMDFSDEGYFVPVRWNDWLELPVREQNDGINTPSRVVFGRMLAWSGRGLIYEPSLISGMANQVSSQKLPRPVELRLWITGGVSEFLVLLTLWR